MHTSIIVLTSTFPRWPGDTDPPFVYELCRRLAADHAVHVVCPRCRNAPEREMREGVSIRRFPYCFAPLERLAYGTGILNKLRQYPLLYALVPLFLIGETAAAARMLAGMDCAAINAHWLIPQGLAAWAAKALARSKAHLVCSLHGADIFALQRCRMLKKFILRRSRAVIVVSSAMRDAVIGLGVPEEAIHVIPMGVDLQHAFVPPAGQRQRKSVLFVGRLVEKKGAAYLVRAFEHVARAHPDAHLRIVGDGPERKNITGLVRRLGLQRQTDVRGALSNADLPELYRSAEIVVLPFIVDAHGDTEGFGLVTVEALGCECAVVASDVPAVHDTIKHGHTGLLVSPKDPDGLARAIVRLIEDGPLRRRLGRQGRAYVQERYDWRHAVEKYSELFAALARER